MLKPNDMNIHFHMSMHNEHVFIKTNENVIPINRKKFYTRCVKVQVRLMINIFLKKPYLLANVSSFPNNP